MIVRQLSEGSGRGGDGRRLLRGLAWPRPRRCAQRWPSTACGCAWCATGWRSARCASAAWRRPPSLFQGNVARRLGRPRGRDRQAAKVVADLRPAPRRASSPSAEGCSRETCSTRTSRGTSRHCPTRTSCARCCSVYQRSAPRARVAPRRLARALARVLQARVNAAPAAPERARGSRA